MKRSRMTLMLAILTAGLITGVSTGMASTFLETDIPTLHKLADAVVVARVTDVTSAWNAEHTMIFSNVTLDVRRTLTGVHRSEITLRNPGGTVDGFTVLMEGAPQFQQGERVMVFLGQWDDGTPRVAGYFQGVSRVSTDASGNETLQGGIAHGRSLASLVRVLRGQSR